MRRLSIFLAVQALVVFSATAVMATPPSPDEVIGTAAADLFDNLMAVFVAVLPYAAGLAAAIIGWRLVRRFLTAR